MTAPAWMPFHVGVYLGDTGHLSTLAHGAYILLILHYWQNDGLPTDDDALARIARMSAREWASVKGILAKLFKAGAPGEWKHKRVEAELATARQMINKRSAAGKAGASARYGNRMAAVRQERSERMASAEQSNSIVRVRNQNQDSLTSLGQSSAPAEEKSGSAEKEEAAFPASIEITSSLKTNRLARAL